MSGVFPTVGFSEVDVEHVLARAIETVRRDAAASAAIECLRDGGSAVVLGVQDKLEEAFTRLLTACVRTTRFGTTVRVALGRQGIHWSFRIQHCFVRVDASVAPELEASLAFARAVMLGHNGTLDVAVDVAFRVRVVALSMPAEEP